MILGSTSRTYCAAFLTSYPQLMQQPQKTVSSLSNVVAGKVKTYVLDTNVLLHDPQSIFKFEENN